MSIDRTSPLKPVSTVRPRGTTDTPITNGRVARATASVSTSMTLSDVRTELVQPGNSDIDFEHVEALRLVIRNSELKTNTGKIADVLTNKAQQDLQSN